MNTARDYNAISPSAKSLLMTKAMTTIPFAREAAMIVWEPDQLKNMLKEKANKESFGWLIHFENRYRTIDTLLMPTASTNILEIASGFSFRGLQLCKDKEVVYIDTDLPDSMKTKKHLVEQLIQQHTIELKGILHMKPLNALDEKAFHEVVDLFPPGAVTIVNEGLMMYLDEPEKRQLCAVIHGVLKKRGGCWITGDIYLKKNKEQLQKDYLSEEAKRFLEEHRV